MILWTWRKFPTVEFLSLQTEALNSNSDKPYNRCSRDGEQGWGLWEFTSSVWTNEFLTWRPRSSLKYMPTSSSCSLISTVGPVAICKTLVWEMIEKYSFHKNEDFSFSLSNRVELMWMHMTSIVRTGSWNTTGTNDTVISVETNNQAETTWNEIRKEFPNEWTGLH